jgi:hypothetical protein
MLASASPAVLVSTIDFTGIAAVFDGDLIARYTRHRETKGSFWSRTETGLGSQQSKQTSLLVNLHCWMQHSEFQSTAWLWDALASG